MAHEYPSRVIWTGNRGDGNATYLGYDRSWNVAIPGKPVVHCSNDPVLGGDPGLMNPEDMLITALSACHMLWFLHLASDAGIVVSAYEDAAVGFGEVGRGGAGRFTAAELRPTITVAPGTDTAAADAIHRRIHEVCFIARSVNFPVRFAPTYVEADAL